MLKTQNYETFELKKNDPTQLNVSWLRMDESKSLLENKRQCHNAWSQDCLKKPFFHQFKSESDFYSSKPNWIFVSCSKNSEKIEIRLKLNFYCFGEGNPKCQSIAIKPY